MHLYLQDTHLKEKLATYLGLQDTRHAGQLGMMIFFQSGAVKVPEAVSVVATRPVHTMKPKIVKLFLMAYLFVLGLYLW
jgi:hypothetical protein